MSTAERTRWVDKMHDIAKKAHTRDADVQSILDDAGLKIKEEVEMDEGTSLQVKMALSDVGLKGTWKNGKVYVKKRDVKKAEKALKGNVIYKGKPPIVVGENFYCKIREVLDVANTKMADVIKDFQDSDAPQFNGSQTRNAEKWQLLQNWLQIEMSRLKKTKRMIQSPRKKIK